MNVGALQRAVLIFAGFLLGLVAGLSAIGHAQIFAGIAAGATQQYGLGNQPHDYSACASATQEQRSAVSDVFVGYRHRYIGIEAGDGVLFHSSFTAECQSAVGSQDVRASQRYLRLQIYLPIGGLELVPFVGRATVKFTNNEVADLRATTGEYITNHTTGHAVSPFYGVGLQQGFERWFARLEYQRTRHVAEDHWTTRGWENSVSTVSFGIGRYF